jgi:hypothetical protein
MDLSTVWTRPVANFDCRGVILADLFVKLIVLFGQGLVPFKLNVFMIFLLSR